MNAPENNNLFFVPASLSQVQADNFASQCEAKLNLPSDLIESRGLDQEGTKICAWSVQAGDFRLVKAVVLFAGREFDRNGTPHRQLHLKIAKVNRYSFAPGPERDKFAAEEAEWKAERQNLTDEMKENILGWVSLED